MLNLVGDYGSSSDEEEEQRAQREAGGGRPAGERRRCPDAWRPLAMRLSPATLTRVFPCARVAARGRTGLFVAPPVCAWSYTSRRTCTLSPDTRFESCPIASDEAAGGAAVAAEPGATVGARPPPALAGGGWAALSGVALASVAPPELASPSRPPPGTLSGSHQLLTAFLKAPPHDSIPRSSQSEV